MKRVLGAVLAVLVILLLCACEGQTQVGSAEPYINPRFWSEQELYRQLFDRENKIQISLDMDDSELAKLQADYDLYSAQGSKSPIYRMADLSVTIITPEGVTAVYKIPQVGVRMKGNTSRTDFYSREEGIYNHIHLKLSFQETFDKPEYYGNDCLSWGSTDRDARKDRTFATLEKLELRWNKCVDTTYLKELYVYDLYRSQGVLAPMTNLSQLTWAGLNMGVYTINEPVDKVFLQRYLPDAALGGDLYKCGWSSRGADLTKVDSIGIEDEDRSIFFSYDLKTNKKSSTHAALTNLITQLNQENVSKEDLEKLLDMDNFLSFAAVSWLLGNPDDYRNNCNNYYIYFRRNDGKAIFIPYDYDRCLGITAQWNPTGDGCTTDDPFSTERLCVDYRDTHADRKQYNPLILYTVARGGYYVDAYAGKLQSLSQSQWVQEEHFASYFTRAQSLYGSDTMPDKEFRNSLRENYRFEMTKISSFSPSGNLSFAEYMDAKLATLHRYLSDPDFRRGDIAIPVFSVYIRADFTDWQIAPAYTMTREGSTYSYTLTVDNEVRLKVYTEQEDRWFGTEHLEPDSVDQCQSDEHTNLVLSAGTYTIAFDSMTQRIRIIPQENFP